MASERCIINLGLYGNGWDGDLFERLRIYYTELPRLMGHAVHRHLIIPGNERIEPTLVASGRILVEHGDTGFRFDIAPILTLCASTNQDCAAVYFPDYSYGVLVGPKADRWGAFDLQSFHLPPGFKV